MEIFTSRHERVGENKSFIKPIHVWIERTETNVEIRLEKNCFILCNGRSK